jgi:hypothetical protein
MKVFKIIKKKIFIIFVFPLIIIEIYRYHKLKQIKICICTIGKQENRYIKEYIEYYKKFGIDKIFLYDNNDLNGEYFENILEKYQSEDFVEIKNLRGIESPQMKMYHDCYNNNYEKYEWLIFNDIDEYLYLKSYNNIKDFLSKRKFKNCENIQLNWLLYTDNNLIHYQNKPLKIRFKEKDPYLNKRKISKFSNGKSILRGHIPNINITNFHCISKDLKTCDGFGIMRKFLKPNYKYYYFKHYYCKSTEEFIDKLKKGDVHTIKNIIKIKFYFSYNKITNEKLNYIEKQTRENLTNFKYKLNLSKKIM